MLFKPFHEIEGKGTLLNLFLEDTITLITKSVKRQQKIKL
jgi:hypothetical protein